MNIIEVVNNFEKAALKANEGLKELENVLSGGPATFYIKVIKDHIEGLYSFAKFKVGDDVILIKDIDPFPVGWERCYSFLKKGANAFVSEVSWRKTQFLYTLKFYDEQYKSEINNEIFYTPLVHSFPSFSENCLKKMEY